MKAKKGTANPLTLPGDDWMALLAERGANPKWGFVNGVLDKKHPGDTFLKRMLEYDQVTLKGASYV